MAFQKYKLGPFLKEGVLKTKQIRFGEAEENKHVLVVQIQDGDGRGREIEKREAGEEDKNRGPEHAWPCVQS